MAARRFGFAGLGQMGGPMAANMAAAGFDLSVHDKAGTAERAPDGAKAVNFPGILDSYIWSLSAITGVFQGCRT